MHFTRIGLAEICNSLGLSSRHQNILATVGFLLAAVVKSLFLGLFGPLTASFGAFNDQIGSIFSILFVLGKLIWVSLWQHAQII